MICKEKTCELCKYSPKLCNISAGVIGYFCIHLVSPKPINFGLSFKIIKMKYLFFTAIAFLIFTGTIQAQNVNIGIKGGLNSYTLLGDHSIDFNPKLGFNLGLLGHIHINSNLAFQPELLYSGQGTTYKISGLDNSIKLNYVNIPLILQYMFDNGFRIQAGPQLGILASANLVRGDSSSDLKDNYKSTDIGLTVGVSYVKPSTGFGIDFRYNRGLTNINSNGTINSYNGGVQLGLFYLFQHRS